MKLNLQHDERCVASPAGTSIINSKRRNLSDYFELPWEGGEPFKLTLAYLDRFMQEGDDLERIYVYISSEQLYGNCLKLKARVDKEDEEIDLLITPDRLGVYCNKQKGAKALCKAVYLVLRKLLKYADEVEKFFENFYHPEVLILGEANYRFFHFDVLYGGAQLGAHPDYGKVFGFTNDSFSFFKNGGVTLSRDLKTRLVYGVPIGYKWSKLPILLPFLADLNPKERSKIKYVNFQKSFLLEGIACQQPLNALHLKINAICKEMLRIFETHAEQLKERLGIDMDRPEYASLELDPEGKIKRAKGKLLYGLWRAVIPLLEGMDVFYFSSSTTHYKLARPKNEILPMVSFSGEMASIAFSLTEKSDHVQLKLIITAGDKVFKKVKPFSYYYWFLIAEKDEEEYYLLPSLEDGELLAFMVRCEKTITVLPKDLERFKKEIFIPISERYAITYQKEEEVGDPYFADHGTAKPIVKLLEIQVDQEVAYFKPVVRYEGGLSSNPLNPGSMLLIDGEGETGLLMRDLSYEKDYRELLLSLHSEFSDQVEERLLSLPFAWLQKGHLLNDILKPLEDAGVEILGVENLRGTSFLPYQPEWSLKVGNKENYFDIDLQVKFGGQSLDLETLQKHIKRGKEHVVLANGAIGLLPVELQDKWKPLTTMGTIQKNSVRLSSRHIVTMQGFTENITDKKLVEQIALRRKKLQELHEVQPIAKPERVQAALRPYQELGFSWMGFLREFGWGGVLADDMGLGKTLQVLTLLAYHYQQEPDSATSLIVVPNSLLFNWQQEVLKFVPHLEVHIYHGTGRVWKAGAGMLVLTTYGTLISDIEILRQEIFSYLVLDEAQSIKNAGSKRFECAQLIRSSYRLALTGTPVENGIADLYAIMDFVNPGFLGSYSQFKQAFTGIADGSATRASLEVLQRTIAPFLLRRTKAQVAKDLPEKTEMTIYCDMLPEQRKIYEQYRKQFRGELEQKLGEGMDKAKFMVVAGLMKLRQICDSPALLNDGEYPLASAKLHELEEHIAEHAGSHKLLVFSAFVSMLKLVEADLKTNGIAYAYLDGKLSSDQRQAQVRRFQDDEDCRVFLISLKAGGTGLNLTAADYVYILDPWWNLAAEAQAIDRCYRIGQDKHVMAYKMICKNSVEEKILAMQARKKDLAENLVQAESAILKSLGKEELLQLFD